MNAEEELTRRLERARRDEIQLPEYLVNAALIETKRSVVAQTRTRRSVAAGALSIAAFSLALATPAAADVIRSFLAQTGEVCESGSECATGEEFIDTRASDTPEFIASVDFSYLPLAPGQTEDSVLEAVRGRYEDVEVLTFESNFRADFENVVYCGWVESWLNAQKSGDFEKMTVASSVLRDSLSWPGPIQQSQEGLYWQSRFAEAAESGSVEGVQTASVFNACPAYAGSANGEWLDQNRPTE